MTDSTTAARQAFLLLRIAFTVAPILFGLDKFAEVLTDDWARYLAPEFNDIIPGSAEDAMYLIGGIIINLLLVGGYGDVALRDFGLMLGALTLARLAWSEVGSTSRAQSRVFQSGTGGSMPATGT